MPAKDEVVDISVNPIAVRRQRRRAILRIGVPVLGVGLVVLAILGIALYSHQANRQGVLALSDNLLVTLDAQISQRVAGFLDPCARVLQIVRELAVKTPTTQRRAVAENFAVSALRELPQVASIYVGDSDGDFIMVQRGKNGGTDEKQIFNDTDARRVTLIERNAAGDEISRRDDPSDEFDPRTRPWYEGALATDGVFWTGVYVFFTSQEPGVTASARVRDKQGKEHVFGVDITLKELSTFLTTLEIGKTGRAVIMDEKGGLIAVPDSSEMLKQSGDEFVPYRVDEIGDPVLTAAFDRFRVEGEGRRVIELEGGRFITSATPVPNGGRDWWVLITVPESDFTGFVASNNRTALAMSLIIVFAVCVLAALLVRQGLRSDRSVRMMKERGHAVARQSAAYATIAEKSAEMGDADGRLPPVLTEMLADMASAMRASIWRLTGGDQTLRCEDGFDRDSQGHAGGFELHRRELPQFFEFLETGEEADIPDAAADRRSGQFYNVTMRPLGSRSLHVVPLHYRDRPAGAICLEDAKTLEGMKDFLRTVASMVSLQWSRWEQPPSERKESPARQPEPRPPRHQPIRSADLVLSSLDREQLKASLYPETAVMVLRIAGPVALAKKAGESSSDLADLVAQILQEAAAEHGVPYLKFVAQQAIAAAGLESDDDTAMTRVATLAVTVRERCSSLFETAGQEAEFHVGLGFGVAFGCGIGQEPRQFNLWGEAVQTADIMAASAGPGSIQASEAAYARLRQDFLFRPRGSFYMPGTGEARTFVLAGQL